MQRIAAFILATVAFLSFAAAPAQAGAPKVITKVPFTISKPGSYVLSSSLKYKGTAAAITILADGVALDLRGNTITADRTLSLTNETAGIFANGQRNITLRNGKLEGFFRGVYLEGGKPTGGHLVEKIEAKDSTFLGIQVKGNRSIVRDCFVNIVGREGGATSFTAVRYGIDLIGDGILVQNNHLLDITVNSNGTTSYGIHIVNSDSAVVESNRLINTQDAFSFGAIGMYLDNCDWPIVARNTITGFAGGIGFANGGNGLYRDNTVTRALAPYSVPGGNATDGGGNK